MLLILYWFDIRIFYSRCRLTPGPQCCCHCLLLLHSSNIKMLSPGRSTLSDILEKQLTHNMSLSSAGAAICSRCPALLCVTIQTNSTTRRSHMPL
jgi:hypothetical protein